ncbi:L,D-transpeptidase family protein [Streptomyces sp. NPDC059578]|uniref:L,D-transpeptidase family protein n=1 Tax=Streptomyces sp. NPDC059578 TaxID=3346874 RepID=UPI00367E9574
MSASSVRSRPSRTRTARGLLAAASCAALLLTGCSGTARHSAEGATGGRTAGERTVSGDEDEDADASPRAGARGSAGPPVEGRPGPGATAAAAVPPGLGPLTGARVPAKARQALVVTGTGRDSSASTAALHQRDAHGAWRLVAGPWPAHNALSGWTDDHRAGDLRTPVGVFGLGDAGGLLPDPGTKLPYDQDEQFGDSGTGYLDESLEGSFDYVLAIDYNRVPGTSPLDKTRPLGLGKGSGIWLHVDHGGPTKGCVSLPRGRMRELLRHLDPALRPVVVMGDAGALRK